MFEPASLARAEKFKLAKAVRKANRRNGVAFFGYFFGKAKFYKERS